MLSLYISLSVPLSVDLQALGLALLFACHRVMFCMLNAFSCRFFLHLHLHLSISLYFVLFLCFFCWTGKCEKGNIFIADRRSNQVQPRINKSTKCINCSAANGQKINKSQRALMLIGFIRWPQRDLPRERERERDRRSEIRLTEARKISNQTTRILWANFVTFCWLNFP